MPPFIAHFKSSKLRRILLILLASALMYTLIMYFSGSLKILLLLATLLSSIWAWREPKPPIEYLEINTQGHATLKFNDQTHQAQLLSGSLITPYACCLKWQIAEKIVHHWVFLDSTDSESFRRLRVWAKFGQPSDYAAQQSEP